MINELSKIIEFHRKQSGLSRNNLADIAGVGKTVIYDLERGKITVRLDTLNKVISALNITLSFDSPLMKIYKEKRYAKG